MKRIGPAKESVLVIAAHPDDEALGCGATMAKHAAAGRDVHVLILAEGLTSRGQKRDRKAASAGLGALGRAARKANGILGAASVSLSAFPDNRMDGVDRLDVVKVVESAIAAHRPSLVYTHHGGDVNIDHRVIHDAVIAACRPQPGHPVRTLLFFEVASSTEWQASPALPAFRPDWFEDVSGTLALKLEALQAYGAEMRPWPHARSIRALEHLARWRGASIGVEAAEAFMVGRHIPG
jgi:LmbE family N-acetylglucosaminyl deacetylase